MIIKKQPFQPVILGADINAYTMARTFHEEYQVKSIVVSKCLWGPSNNSKIIENIVEGKLEDEVTLLETLITIAKSRQKQKLILFACGDWYLQIIVKNKKLLSAYYVLPYIDYDLMQQVVLKDNFYQLCAELEIDYPETIVYDVEDVNPPQVTFNYPIVVKAADSVAYHYAKFSGKKKGFKFRRPRDFNNMLQQLRTSSYKGKLIIQDYIPGADSNMYVLTCYSDQQGKVQFQALGHVLLEEHTPGAIGNYAAIVTEQNSEIFEQAKRLLEHLKYTGFSNLDLKYDPRDGKYKFLELNARLGRSNYYVTGSGYNVAKFIVDEYIYKKKLTFTIATNEHLYLAVPPSLLYRYLTDKTLKRRVKGLIKSGQYSNPLYYKADMCLKRYFYIRLHLLNQFRKYYKYYEVLQEPIMREKFVGVLGGLGPLSTVTFMELVINNTVARKDQEHINMVVINHATVADRVQHLLNNGYESPLAKLIADVKRLEEWGVKFIVIPCNTAHAFYKEIKANVQVPVINMIAETIIYTLRENPKVKQVGLLATDATVQHRLYEKVMAQYGIKCIVPDEEEQAQVDALIFDQVKAGLPVDTKLYHQLIASLRAKGAEKVILGCTELSIINQEVAFGEPEVVIDALTVLAYKTILLSKKNIKANKDKE